MGSKNRRDKDRPFTRGSLNRRAPDGSRLFLTIEDTAVHFAINKSTVLEWTRLGVVPHYTIGGRVYFNKDEVAAYWAMFQPERRY
jgi:excisionase family DNA binding protein